MEINGERQISASRDQVWAALNNVEVLKFCIPGCEDIESVSETQMNASAALKVGPITAKLQGTVTLSDILPPTSYKVSFSGKGAAGFAKGSAAVELIDQTETTLLRYSASTQIGGKLAQLGGRLIDSTAKTMTEQFFTKFTAVVEQPVDTREEQLPADHDNDRTRNTAAAATPHSSWLLGIWLWVKRVMTSR
jgi:carbon monoxide dehydrogenase subunit G